MSDRSERKEKTGRNFIASAIFGAITIALVKWLSPDTIPFGAFEFWRWDTTLGALLAATWPIFAWGGGVTAVFALITKNSRATNRDAESIIVGGTVISVLAGVFEEICFRWLIFLSSIFWVKVANFLLLGFMGWGIPEHLFQWIFRPLADWTTLGGLHAQLYHPATWAVGAAMLSANGFFRDGHKYQGPFGWINSWFCGMFFFWVMFSFGLPAAILIHFLYDLLIFFIRYVDAVIERAQGNA